MSGEKDLEQLKKEAVEKAKAAAAAKRAAKAAQEASGTDVPVHNEPPAKTEKPESKSADSELEKKKAAAAAKAKAAALAKQRREAGTGNELTQGAQPKPDAEPVQSDDQDLAKKKAAAAAKAKAAAQAKQAGSDGTDAAAGDEKAKAIAAAKAKAAAAAKAKAAAQAKQAGTGAAEPDGADEKAKAIAAAKAKAAAAAKERAAASAKSGGEKEEAAQAAPSPNKPYLDKYVKVIEENLGAHVLEDSYINKLSKDVPTLVAKPDTYFKVAQFLKFNEQLSFDYLSELHGADFETHMELYVHLYSYKNRQSVALKVKINRDEPTIESLHPLWAGANWPECEAYDLLGITFTGHPKLHRILLGDDWVGHPLRKDYEQYDVEV
ncbi:NADH-quinone oxidoreductase subunit C [Bacillus sp. EB01]|uniref:NADH-quinone oxidoreductase subunit C n=1 Tax=Bacillus sp. EB01 TaxID=1347086 RepID=UPI0005C76D03|nr:NADH-quinone oxidoreductase subunit C [Bacillus sp. EB01]